MTDLPYLTSPRDFCRAPPHTPKGVVVRQLQKPHLPHPCRTLGAAGTAKGKQRVNIEGEC
jgi:hypothetical protein